MVGLPSEIALRGVAYLSRFMGGSKWRNCIEKKVANLLTNIILRVETSISIIYLSVTTSRV